MGIKIYDLEFSVSNDPENPSSFRDEQIYSKIAVSTQYGIGFMIKNSGGYVHSLFGPEAIEVLYEYDLHETEVIDLYCVNGRWYYPEKTIDHIVGNRDFLLDGTVFKYEESVELEDGEDAVKLRPIEKKDGSLKYDSDVVYTMESIKEKFDEEDALALWPLIERANR